MKNEKLCPKCNGNNILRFEGEIGPYGTGNNMQVSFFHAVKVHRYICASCGFTEEWVDREDIQKIATSKKVKR